MSTPEQRRKIIEEIHAQSSIGREFLRLKAALGEVVDRKSVVQIASDVLKSNPVEADGVTRIGNFEFRFDANDRLIALGDWAGGIIIKGDSPDRR